MATTIRILFRTLFISGILSTVLVIWLAWQVDQAGRGDPVEGTDAIAVLGARVRADGSPGRDLYNRTRWAVRLYEQMAQAGYRPVLITTGGTAGSEFSGAAVARRMAIEWGIPAERIILADGGQSTEDDGRFTAQRMAENGWESVTLVSHPLHLFRSRWHFERAGIPEVRTYAAGNREWIRPGARVYLSGREAAGVVWGAINGWKHFGQIGLILESVVYPRRA